MPRERSYLRYQLYRSEARKATSITTKKMLFHEGADFSKVRFEAIDAQAMSAFELWDNPHFSWGDVVTWKTREPLSLDVAIWFEQELRGLCFVIPNNSRQRIRIVRLEGRPGEAHPLKNRIAALAMLAIDEFAQIIGSRLIEVQEPMQGAIPKYRQLGFTFDLDGRLVLAVEGKVL
ncbi:hypothetical protein [Pseudomonas sp. SCA2728.1_7]|uniref:hypothetical protein n=1 Tax=Pseudomonas sp. SCA2728.1_7 TaxID=2825975 RepID=UPI001BAFAB7E|nr:hypothetical protein [Pseudomonas sp. SCA2728.1_7]QUE92919.1 hypothetical protein KBP52_11085 [Pseudomonas sp. SCA2728.1_7]